MMNFHSQREVRLSVPEWMKIIIGIKLIRKEVLTVRVIVAGEFLRLFDSMGKMMGVDRVARVRSMSVFRTSSRSITFTWICTKVDGS